MSAPADEANTWKDVTDNLNNTAPNWHPTEVHPRLWLGGTPDHDLVVAPGTLTSPWAPSIQRSEFDSCLTLTPVAGPAGTGVVEYRLTFPDTRKDYPYPRDAIVDAATWGAQRWDRGDRLVVRCRAGRNRSGLLAALMIARIEPELDWTQIVRHLREARHASVLNNPRLVELGSVLAENMRRK